MRFSILKAEAIKSQVTVNHLNRTSAAMENLFNKCELPIKCEIYRKQFAEDLKIEKSNSDLMKNHVFLVNQNFYLRDVQFKSLQQKLSEI